MFKLTGKREKGNEAEQIACDHLTKNGYRIITRNFNCRVGEIDIIAQNGEDLVFVEVRSWHSAATVNPIDTISRRKQERVIRAAEGLFDKACACAGPCQIRRGNRESRHPAACGTHPKRIRAGAGGHVLGWTTKASGNPPERGREREGKNAGEPAFCKKPDSPHPLRQKLLNMNLQSCAGDKLVTVSRIRNHLVPRFAGFRKGFGKTLFAMDCDVSSVR